jgi:hypothetical protein
MTPFEALFGYSPNSGYCIFCRKKLVENVDTDFAVCNDCWTATFACEVCGDEEGECVHRNPEDFVDEPYIGTYFVEEV